MPPSLHIPETFAIAALMGLALAGGPLLWALLKHQPVSRRACWRAAWTFVAITCWMTIGNIASSAKDQGLISLSAFFAATLLPFLVFVGVFSLIDRHYPEPKDS